MSRRAADQDEEPSGRPLDADRLEGVLHPRDTHHVLGHDRPEAAFLSAWNAGRPHHAWLLRGQPGIGKACFAYRIARFLLSRVDLDEQMFARHPEQVGSLDVPALDPALRQIEAGGHPGLIELRRPWDEKAKRFKKDISVAQVRRLLSFFQMSAADAGWRVAIVDPAEDMTTGAANALLKALEEPPARAMFLLVSHAPGRLPATIRSRCRTLDFAPLPGNLAAVAISEACDEVDAGLAARLDALCPGAPGEALRLHRGGGLETYGALVALLSSLPRLDRGRLSALMSETGKGGAEGLARTGRLLRLVLERVARTGAYGQPPAEAVPGEAQMLTRLAPTPLAARAYAEAAMVVSDKLEAALGLNLDPSRTVLDIALYLEQLSRQTRA
ncbi:MAG: DNA polymerase III subunit delta' [Neomegalonema sp.]|nr:DNA polymerase III subunit delta' [Neomegalonema sp.]